MMNKNSEDDFYSERNLAKRFILSEEIANLTVFLVSDAGNMIVDDTVYCSGGSGVIILHNQRESEKKYE